MSHEYDFYIALFSTLAVAAIGFELRHQYTCWSSDSDADGDRRVSASFLAFRKNYLVVYSLMMAGDWLQGPYIYVRPCCMRVHVPEQPHAVHDDHDHDDIISRTTPGIV